VDGVLSTRFSSEPFAASPESALVRFFDAPARTDPAGRMHAPTRRLMPGAAPDRSAWKQMSTTAGDQIAPA